MPRRQLLAVFHALSRPLVARSRLAADILNPFGTQTPAGLAFLNSSLLLGEYLDARQRSTGVDLRATRDLLRILSHFLL